MTHDAARRPAAAPLTDEPHPHFGLDIPFMRHIGLVPVAIEPERAVARLPKARFLENSRGDHHGGALMAALDFMMSAAARSHDPLGYGVITIEMSTHFLSAANGDLTIECRTLRRGARIAFCDGTVSGADGQVVCVSRAAFKLVPKAKTASRPVP